MPWDAIVDETRFLDEWSVALMSGDDEDSVLHPPLGVCCALTTSLASVEHRGIRSAGARRVRTRALL